METKHCYKGRYPQSCSGPCIHAHRYTNLHTQIDPCNTHTHETSLHSTQLLSGCAFCWPSSFTHGISFHLSVQHSNNQGLGHREPLFWNSIFDSTRPTLSLHSYVKALTRREIGIQELFWKRSFCRLADKWSKYRTMEQRVRKDCSRLFT